MEPVTVNTFENLKDVKTLAAWVTDKNDEVQRFIKANDGKWDDDRIAILETRTKEVQAAQDRLSQLQRVEQIYQRTVATKKDMNEPRITFPLRIKAAIRQ